MNVLPIEIAKARDVLLALADAEPTPHMAEIFRLVAGRLQIRLLVIAHCGQTTL